MIWVIVFLVILALGHGHLIFELEQLPAFLGLPQWVYYYICIHLLYIAALSFFSKYIKEEEL